MRLLLAPPGGGKGTQGAQLADRLGDRPPEAIATEVLTRLSERSPLRGSP